MKNLRRFWNQNRGKIIITIAVIAFIFAIIQIFNQILKENNSSENVISTVDKSKPIQSVITGQTVSEEKTEKNTDSIKEFVEYCNNKQYQQAFSLLSKQCQKEFNNDINYFINSYIKNVFSVNRTYNLELWLSEKNSYTYKITYYPDNLLATGGTGMNQNVEDYVTIINEDDENKLNINEFIAQKEINKSQTIDNIEFIINSKKVYKDYETYSVTIRNRSDKTILIANGQNNEDICLIDSKDVKYPSFLHEILFENLSLNSGYEKNIDIRFNKIYDLYRVISKIQFSNVILDMEKYMQNPNDEEIEKVSISIDV